MLCLMKLNIYFHFLNYSFIQNLFYFVVYQGQTNTSTVPLLKYKYYICYAPVVQQQEVFDACFNISVDTFVVPQEGNTQFSL